MANVSGLKTRIAADNRGFSCVWRKAQFPVKGNQLDRWYDDNAEAISFGQFYRENFPKQYREWHTVQWQRDIALRDSICHAHSLDHLKLLYEAGE